MDMKEFKAPNLATEYETDEYVNIFLAGSIDMGSSPNWQNEIVESLVGYDVNIFNPRRDDWDSSWEQSINNEQFREQVEWELDHLELCDLTVFYFAPGSKAPISFFELGFKTEGYDNIVVCCPEGFYRKGNIDIICERYDIDQVANIDELKKYIQDYVVDTY